MKTEQNRWRPDSGWDQPIIGSTSANLVLLFADRILLQDNHRLLEELSAAFPNSQILGCSTSGEIMGVRVFDNSLCITVVEFEKTGLQGHSIALNPGQDSYAAGQELARQFATDGLKHLFVISDGLKVNGSELVRGLSDTLPKSVTISGGLSGDADRFEQTLVLWGTSLCEGQIAAIGFYGDDIKIGCASLGGWDPFGPERLVTRSKGNVLYELDGQSALSLYKEYLGDHASGLPATGLLFPLSLRLPGNDKPVVRTILAVDEKEQSMTFAGDVAEGCYARLMKANFDRLVDGAVGAAEVADQALGGFEPELALLISCVGRKLILKQRVEDEVEAVREVLGEHAVLSGFYSYGEISPFTPEAKCELHNQTMTITALAES